MNNVMANTQLCLTLFPIAKIGERPLIQHSSSHVGVKWVDNVDQLFRAAELPVA